MGVAKTHELNHPRGVSAYVCTVAPRFAEVHTKKAKANHETHRQWAVWFGCYVNQHLWAKQKVQKVSVCVSTSITFPCPCFLFNKCIMQCLVRHRQKVCLFAICFFLLNLRAPQKWDIMRVWVIVTDQSPWAKSRFVSCWVHWWILRPCSSCECEFYLYFFL